MSQKDNAGGDSQRSKEERVVLKNRPNPARWRQQDIAACRPIYTARVVITFVFLIGFTFIPLGYICLVASDSVKEWKHEYQNCGQLGYSCELNVYIQEDFEGDVYFYYGLGNYHQNLRRYLKNWNAHQMIGDLGCTVDCSNPYKRVQVNLTKSDCERGRKKGPDDSCYWQYWEKGKCYKPIAPCGALANSMFSDTFKLKDSTGQDVPWSFEGLLWEKDLKVFRNPKLENGETLCDAFNKRSAKPPLWKKSPCELDPQNPKNNGFENFDFIVWMNSAAYPVFKKPYRKLKRDGKYANGLPKGIYKLQIQNDYNVLNFKGKKYFIITTTSWLGSKNRFFGISFLTVGCLCLFAGTILIVIHMKIGHTLENIAHIPRYANDKQD